MAPKVTVIDKSGHICLCIYGDENKRGYLKMTINRADLLQKEPEMLLSVFSYPELHPLYLSRRPLFS